MHRVFRKILQGLIVTLVVFFVIQTVIRLYDFQGIYISFFVDNARYPVLLLSSVFSIFVLLPYDTIVKKTILTIIVLLHLVIGISFFSGLTGMILIYRLIILGILCLIQMLLGQRNSRLRYLALVMNTAFILVVISIVLLPIYDTKPTLPVFYTAQQNTLHMFIGDIPLIIQETQPIISYKIGSSEKTTPITAQTPFPPIQFTQQAVITLSARQQLQNTYAVIQMYDGEIYPIPTQAGIELSPLSASGYDRSYINHSGDVRVSLDAQLFIDDLIQEREQAFYSYVIETIGGERVIHPVVDRYINTILQIAYTAFPGHYFTNIQNYYASQLILEQLGMKERAKTAIERNPKLPDTTQLQESLQNTFLYKRLFIQE